MNRILDNLANAHTKIACEALWQGCYFSGLWIDCVCIHKRTYACIPVVIDEETSYCTCELTEDTYVKCGECVEEGVNGCGVYITCTDSCTPVNPGDECPGDCPNEGGGP